MSAKRKHSKSANNDVLHLAFKGLVGSAVNILLFFTFTLLASLICLKTDTDSEKYKYILFFIGAVSSLTGGFAAVHPVRKYGLTLGTFSALPAYFVTALICSLVSQSGIGAAGWIMAGIFIFFSAVGGVLGANK